MNSEFLQSQEWADFQTAQGHQAISFGGYFAFKKKMKLGLRHLYVPRIEATRAVVQNIEETAKSAGADFIRFEPTEIRADINLPKLGYQKVKDYQPAHNWQLDLTAGKDELLAGMHQKTRYNIRLAEKKGVVCRTADLSEYDKFWKLISATYGRKEISTHSEKYYKLLLENMPGAYLAFAEYDGKVIVANLMIRYGNTVTYLHGGSDNDYKQLMAPHLLQWAEIERAKNDGFIYYDFGGIAPTDDPAHPWAGITRFKKGFGGFMKEYPGTFEKGLNTKYSVYKILRRLR